MVRTYVRDRIPAVYDLDDVPMVERRPGVTQQYFRGLDAIVGFTHVDSSAEPSDPHRHPWEQINLVMAGSCPFVVDGERFEVSSGDVFLVPPDVPHGVEPPDDGVTICFVSPLREDFLDDTAYQEEFDGPS